MVISPAAFLFLFLIKSIGREYLFALAEIVIALHLPDTTEQKRAFGIRRAGACEGPLKMGFLMCSEI